MFAAFKKYKSYNELEAKQIKLAESDGYTFLNSKTYMDLQEEKKNIERNLIEFMLNKNQMLRIWNSFYEEHENREIQMLKNIYEYSKVNKYDKAIFTVGAGHRKSIMQKVQKTNSNEEFKLNWAFYGE